MHRNQQKRPPTAACLPSKGAPGGSAHSGVLLTPTLWRKLEIWMRGKGLGDRAGQLLKELATVRRTDVVVQVRGESQDQPPPAPPRNRPPQPPGCRTAAGARSPITESAKNRAECNAKNNSVTPLKILFLIQSSPSTDELGLNSTPHSSFSRKLKVKLLNEPIQESNAFSSFPRRSSSSKLTHRP